MTARQRTIAVVTRVAQLPPKLPSLSLLATALILIPTFILLASSFDTAALHNAVWAHGSIRHAKGAKGAVAGGGLSESLLKGGAVMPKLKNATAKAELGRASWLLLHTTVARLPEHPNEDEREAFSSFLYLFSRVYPCGECASEFQAILKKHPPQTSSRNAASMYMCYVHNLVNERLDKPIFDCSSGLEGIYDCGCAEDEADAKVGTGVLKGQGVDDGEGGKRDPLTGEEMMGGSFPTKVSSTRRLLLLLLLLDLAQFDYRPPHESARKIVEGSPSARHLYQLGTVTRNSPVDIEISPAIRAGQLPTRAMLPRVARRSYSTFGWLDVGSYKSVRSRMSPLSSPRHLPYAFVMSCSSLSIHRSRLLLFSLLASTISAAPIPQLVNANAFAAQGGITFRLGDAVPTNLAAPPTVFTAVSALPILSAPPSRTAPLTLPIAPTPTKIVGPASPISTPSVVQKTVVVVATITVAPTLPTPTPTTTAASGNTWSLASNFGSDLPNELGVLTWEWGQTNVVVLPGVPAAAWATPTTMPVSVAPPVPLATPSPAVQLNASTVVPIPILAPAVHAVMAAPHRLDLTNSTVMQVLFPNGSINPANKNAPVGGTGMYMTPIDLSQANNVTFEYSVFFPTGFDFVKGGKLPGMYGGHTGCSGGQQSEDCFSTRIMFRTGGMGELYLYIPKDSQPPALCQTPPLSYCDTPYGLSIGRGAWTFKTGEWTNIRQDIRLNTPGVADGGFEIHINGALMLQSSAVMFRKDMSVSDAPVPDNPTPAAQRPGLIGGLLGGILKKETTNSTAARRDSLPLLPATRPRVDSPPLPISGSLTTTNLVSASFRPVPLRTGAATSTPLTASTVASTTVPISTAVALPLASTAPVATAAIGAIGGLLGAAGGVLGQMGAALHASPHRRSLQLSPSPTLKPKSKSKGKGASMVAKEGKLVTFSGTMWDTFFGGNSVSYASPRDQYIYFNRVALKVNV